MKTRVITALVLIPILLAVLFAAPPILLALLCSFLCAIGAYELLDRTGLVKNFRLVIYSMLFAFAVPIWCQCGMPGDIARLAVFVFTALLFAEILISHGKLPVTEAAVCYMGAFVIPYLLSALVRIMGDGSGRTVIMLPFVLAYIADSGAYFVGSAWGHHKLAPNISPKKSIEGFIGGILANVVAMLVYCVIMDTVFDHGVNYLYAITYGILGALAGTFGDLSFSAIKRQSGIKDYGNLLPGHGGVLDRFDSVIIVAPLTEFLLAVLPVLE